MKIVKKTESQLILQDESRFSGWTNWILGAIFTLLGVDLLFLTIFWFARPISFTCQRITPTQGNCELVRLNKSLYPETIAIDIPLTELQGAKVERYDLDDSQMYQVMLITHSGDIPFVGYYTSGFKGTKYKITSQINQFVKNSNQITLDIKEREPLLEILLFVGTFFILMFGWSSMSREITSYIFAQDLSKLILKKQNAFGANFREYQLSEIVDVILEAGKPDSDYDIYYKVSIWLASGDRVIIFQGYNQGQLYQEIVEQIRNYLNLQLIIS